MKLKDWFRITGTTQQQLSAATGIDQSLISKYKTGKCTPSLPQACIIKRATNDLVTFDSWCDVDLKKVRVIKVAA